MKTCEYCGRKITDDAKYCEYCGGSVSERRQEPVAPLNTYPQPVSSDEKESALGIVALIFSILFSSIIGFILGIISVKKYEKHICGTIAVIVSTIKMIAITIGIIIYITISAGVLGVANHIATDEDFVSGIEEQIGGIVSSFEEIESNLNDADNSNVSLYITKDEPITINDYSYEGKVEISAEISDVEYNLESYPFDDDVDANITYVVKMTKNVSHSKQTYVHVNYNIKDEEGIIVKTGSDMVGPMSVGDSMRGEFNVFGLEKDTEYTIEFIDNKY